MVVLFTEVEKQDMKSWEDENFNFDMRLLRLGGMRGRCGETKRF